MSIFSEQFEEEIANLNRLLDDSHLTTSALLQLLRDHNVPVGSPELIKAREKVEAEIQTLRTANAGLVEKVASLEKENARLRAGGCARDQRTTQFCAEAVALAEKLRDRERERDHANDTADAVLSEAKMLRAKLQVLEAARTQAAANSLANMLSYEELEAKMRRLKEAGDRMAIYAELGGVPLKFVGVVNAWREAKGQP